MKRNKIIPKKDDGPPPPREGYGVCDVCLKYVKFIHGCTICDEKGLHPIYCHKCAGIHVTDNHNIGFAIKSRLFTKEYYRLLDEVNSTIPKKN